MKSSASVLLSLALLAGASGCVTTFSPEMIRDEIRDQQGTNPRKTLETNLGRFSTSLFKRVFNEGGGPLAGMTGLELAVFDVETRSAPALDVSQIRVRGWESLARIQSGDHSGMVLVRGGSSLRRAMGDESFIRELVVVGSSAERVVYARVWGRLDPNLPEKLGETLREEGGEGIQDLFTSARH